METDPRIVPWAEIRRLALQAGLFPPAALPVTEGELAELLTRAQATGLSQADPADLERLQILLSRYGRGRRGRVWTVGQEKDHSCSHRVRLGGRLRLGWGELGSLWARESGLAWGPGWNLTVEPGLDWASGSWWFSGSVRGQGPVARGRGEVSPALTWPGWPVPTGRLPVAKARLEKGQWTLTAPRGLLGVRLGRWSLSAGWSPRQTGPGLGGALVLDQTAPSFPAVTVRRTHPFAWRGFLRPLAPADLLLRAGILSKQQVDFQDDWGLHTWRDRPWFMQWLVGWRVTSWLRATANHAVLAVPWEGTLWPDLLQVNFPLQGTTWRESDSGPVTDRIFAAQLEVRWRRAPWPLLPAAAGRLYWDYAGTDYAPSGPGGWIPEIAAPASVAGIELVSPRWDLAVEYAELEHPQILWYSNGGYAAGYSHQDWVLGHPLGGTGSSLAVLVRLRPAGWPMDVSVQAIAAEWGIPGLTPGTGRRRGLQLTLGRPLAAVPWEISGQWNREEVDPGAYATSAIPAGARDWWRLASRLEF